MHRAFVKSYGIVSSLGIGVYATQKSLFGDKEILPSLPRKVQTTLQLPVFEVPGMEPEPDVAGGFSMQMLKSALHEALERAGMKAAELCGRRIGVCIGTTVACQLNDIPFYASLRSTGNAPADPFRKYIQGMPAEWIKHEYHLNGPAITVSNACSSGADAIGIASLWIRQGLCDMAIAGGTDEVNKVPLDGFNALGVCSAEPCRPFDRTRSGLNLGEAAGIVILSNDSKAQLEICGFGKSADAFHITQPEPEGDGLQKAMLMALEGHSADEVAFINAHGTGTQANDAVESKVFSRLFGSSAIFMSTKALTGHTLGAAGAIECIFTCMMLERQIAVKSWRFSAGDDAAEVAPLRENTQLRNGAFALSTSLAFGGSNTCLAVGRTDA